MTRIAIIYTLCGGGLALDVVALALAAWWYR
jgi:hypothetical protein